MQFDSLLQDIRAGRFQPVYYLFGEEPYFVQQLATALEQHAVDDASRSFNLDVLYGADVKGEQVANLCRAYPVMAPRRLVLVREAHRLAKAELDKLADYIRRPVPTTVLALIAEGKNKPDARTAFGKILDGKDDTKRPAGAPAPPPPVVFESKPLYEKDAVAWVEQQFRLRELPADPAAAHTLVEAVGLDIGRLSQEVEKIALYLAGQPKARVTKVLIYDMASIDRSYNMWELRDTLAERNAPRALEIAHRMMDNLRDNPVIPIVSQLSLFYANLGICLEANCRNENDVARVLGLAPFMARSYTRALGRYTLGDVQVALRALYEADLALKGINDSRMDEAHVCITLVLQLLSPAMLLVR